MNIYITSGTTDYLINILRTYPNEEMVILQNKDTSLLIHETASNAIIKEPWRYEVISAIGKVTNEGFAAIHYVPVTDEGKTLYEYNFKKLAEAVREDPGLKTIRLLRPIKSDTYIFFTIWESENNFTNWQATNSLESALTINSSDQGKKRIKAQIYPRPSYMEKYMILSLNRRMD